MQLMEDGSALGTPTPSCTAQKPGRGTYTAFPLLLHLLICYTLHGKQATTHTPASCVKKRIYSERTQYSIATKATAIALKKQQNTNFKTTTKTSKSSPPCSIDPWPSGPNKPPVASDPSPTPSLPGKAQRVSPDLWQHLMPTHPTPPVRVLPPEGLGQQFAVVLSHAVMWGGHTPKKMGQALAYRTGKLPQPHWGWTQP